MLTIQNLSYTHLNKDLLFSGISLTVNNQQKIALIGNNGVGKSTLLKIIAKELQPSEGILKVETQAYYIPQAFGQYNHLSIAEALQIDEKLNALKDILNGSVSEENFRSEEHTSELQSRENLVCRLLLEKKKRKTTE